MDIISIIISSTVIAALVSIAFYFFLFRIHTKENVAKSIDFQSATEFLNKKESYDRLSGETRKMILLGRIRLIPGQVIHRIYLGDSSIANRFELIDYNNSHESGISDFHMKKLRPETNLVFNRLRIAYGEGKDPYREAGVRYSNFREDINPVLVNSKLKVEQQHVAVVNQHICKLLSSKEKANTKGAQIDIDFPLLNEYGLLVGDKETEILLDVPQGLSFEPTYENHAYIELIFDGMLTVPR